METVADSYVPGVVWATALGATVCWETPTMRRIATVGILAGLVFTNSASAFDQADLNRFLETNECEDCALTDIGTALAGRDSSGAKLAGADLSANNYIRSAILDYTDFQGAMFVDSRFLDSSAIGAIFISADMTDVGIINSIMREADFAGAILVNANITNADLRNAVLTGADLSGAQIVGALLRGADLSGANLSGATLDRSSITDADLTDADLTGATIVRMSLSSAILCRTTMPDGSVNNDDCP